MFSFTIAFLTLFYALPIFSATISPSIHLFTDDEPYHPRCRRITRPPPHALPGLSPTKCEGLMPAICGMATINPYRNRWVWYYTNGCALGFFLPQAAEPPEEVECQFLMFNPLINKCAFDSRYNAGGVNVGELPSPEGNGTSETDEDSIRFMLASAPLTTVEDSVVAKAVNDR